MSNAHWPRFYAELQAALSADPSERPGTRQVTGAWYSRVTPRVASQPHRLAVSQALCASLGFAPDFVDTEVFTEAFVGNRLLPGMAPYAMCYGGHQFGQWAGQLGDGRVINLGEVRDSSGELQVIQLKGAGPTPYSRFADGLAVLRSSLREFLCSEAMHHLGVPTTRALSLVLTGDHVQRDMFYDGNPRWEPGAVVARVAPSFIRFGHFEIAAARGDLTLLRQLMAFVLRQHHPALWTQYQHDPKEAVLAWFEWLCERSVAMLLHWMRLGFVHGVMNTDNMSVLGLTIDYGPYGWLDNFDPDWTPNTTDAQQRRYRYDNQPGIVQWNLLQLANAIYPLVEAAAPLEQSVRDVQRRYDIGWREMMAAKLGLDVAHCDEGFARQLLTLMSRSQCDMTCFFRDLARFDATRAGSSADIDRWLGERSYSQARDTALLAEWQAWFQSYAERGRGLDPEVRGRRMDAVNPHFVLRNYVAQLAIEGLEKGDDSVLQQCLDALQQPYDDVDSHLGLCGLRPDWALHKAGCSMLSCSS